MSCDQTERISVLMDGELAPAEAFAIERHLVTCSECQQARADFLGLRSQISTYRSQLNSLETRRALDRVLSQDRSARQAQKSIALIRRPAFFGTFGMPRFNPALAAVLVFLMVGAIAFVVYRAQRSIGRDREQVSATSSQVISPKPIDGESSTQDQLTALGRKPSKTRQTETGSGPRKPDSRVKPSRERTAPKPLPQLQRYEAAPTYASLPESTTTPGVVPTRPAGAEMLTARHLEQSELLLRAFRNIRSAKRGRALEIAYERRRAQQLLYQNMLLRREADNAGDVQVATLLGSLEPILLDIANLPDRPHDDEVGAIRDRVERKSLVPLLQISSTTVARANE